MLIYTFIDISEVVCFNSKGLRSFWTEVITAQVDSDLFYFIFFKEIINNGTQVGKLMIPVEMKESSSI